MMAGWRPALRIAAREARRAKGRAALVVALIALPVFALTFVAVSYDSFRLSPEQEITRDLGAADAQLRWKYDGPAWQTPRLRAAGSEPGTGSRDTPATAAELREVLPPGTRAVPQRFGTLAINTAAGQAELSARWLDPTDPIHGDRVVLRSGRAPSGDSEAALTRRAADRLGAGLGDELVSADGQRRWTVTGIAEFPFRFRTAVLLPTRPGPAQATEWLVDTPEAVTWEQVQRLNAHGIVVRSREVLRDPPPPSQVDTRPAPPEDDDTAALATGALLCGLALLEVVLLAGPAFAVGARRRQRQLGLVAASGGTPAHQRRLVLADGVVFGAIGAAVGIGMGVATALGMMLLLEEQLMGRRAGGLGVFPTALLGVAGLAVLTGLAAALVPAATAARQHVVTALAGRRGATRARRRWLVLGLAGVAAGASLAGLGAWRVETGPVLAGLILGQLGLVLCTPALVGLVSRLGRWLPLAPRIALRDTARNRAAAAPAISAVMAAVTGALALGVYVTASEQRAGADYRAGLPVGHVAVPLNVPGSDGSQTLPAEQRAQAERAVTEALPVDRVHEVAAATCPDGMSDGPCAVEVPLADQHRCPAVSLRDERIAQLLENGGHIDVGSVLTEEEQRAARADPRCQEPRTGWQVHLGRALVDDGAALPALVGGDGDDLVSAREVLARGGVVVADPRRVVNGRATLQVSDSEGAVVDEVRVPAFALTSGERVPFAVLSPGVLATAGLERTPAWLVADTTSVPTQAAQDALRQQLAAVRPELERRFQLETGPVGERDPFLLVLGVVAGVVALAAAGIATGLAAADRRGDLATLAAVGATPRVRRLLSASQSGVVAGLGALLGTAAGLGSAYAVLAALNQAEAHVWPVPAPPYQLVVPWPQLALLLLVVPAVATLGTGLLTRSRLPAEHRRP